jgi:hypothetical protein
MGEYVVGEDAIAFGTRFRVKLQQHKIGWKRWKNNAPTENVMGYLHQGFLAPDRNSLGHLDETVWELGQNREPRDPFQQSDEVPFVADDGQEYLFATGTFGGRRALVQLEKAFKVDGMRRDPVVELGSERSRTSKGAIYHRPIFHVVGWMTDDLPAEQSYQPMLPAKKTASEIVGDSIDDVSPVSKDVTVGKVKPAKRPPADSNPSDPIPF